MPQRLRQRAPYAALVALLAVAAWPWLFLLPLGPTSHDAAFWIARANPADPDWFSWTFSTEHFGTGFRPTTALTYTLGLLAGPSSVLQRAIDLCLHLGAGAALWALFRRLAPRSPDWSALLAAAVFLAHPIAATVVPNLAERSHSLGTVLGLLGLLAISGATGRRASPGQSALATVCLTLAVLADPAALLSAAAACVLVRSAQPAGWSGHIDSCRTLAAPAAGIALALALGAMAAPGGGHGPDLDRSEGFLPIAAATLQAFGGVLPSGTGSSGTESSGTGTLGDSGSATILTTLVLAIATFYALTTLTHRRRDDEGRIAVLATLWLAGLLLFHASRGAWLPAQVYPSAAPLGLLVAATATLTARRFTDTSPSHRAMVTSRCLPQLLLLLLFVWHSPLVRGLDPTEVAARQRTDAVHRELVAWLARLNRDEQVALTLPWFPHGAADGYPATLARRGFPPLAERTAKVWSEAVLGEDCPKVEPALLFACDPRTRCAGPRLLEGDGAPVLATDKVHLSEATLPGKPGLLRVTQRSPQATRWYFHDGRTALSRVLASPDEGR